MPHDNSTAICGVDRAECHYKAMKSWPDMSRLQEGETIPCDCYPTCNDIRYSVKDESSAPYYMDINSKKEHPYYNALVTVMFEDHAIEEYESFIAYRLQNFIGEFGEFFILKKKCF
jgi:Amiloride-sensitive sodium channel